VLIEALSYGLPCIVHDYINAKQVLGENAIYLDMTNEGNLAKYFSTIKTNLSKEALIQAAYNRYSWNVLKEGYLKMITDLIK
jgi:1,2-diacylglycerol 3-alpha-glucosyltransferase